jgi:hypothetical protein
MHRVAPIFLVKLRINCRLNALIFIFKLILLNYFLILCQQQPFNYAADEFYIWSETTYSGISFYLFIIHFTFFY